MDRIIDQIDVYTGNMLISVCFTQMDRFPKYCSYPPDYFCLFYHNARKLTENVIDKPYHVLIMHCSKFVNSLMALAVYLQVDFDTNVEAG